MCLADSMIAPNCEMSVGGVRKIWMARRAVANTYTYDLILGYKIAGNDNVIYSVTNNGAAVMWLEFHVDASIVNLTENMGRSDAGTNFVQQIPLRFANLDPRKRATLRELLYDKVVVILEDMQGEYWLAGQQFGLRPIEYSATTGTQSTFQGYTVTLQADDIEQFRQIDSGFLTNVAVNGSPSVSGGITPIKNVGGSGPGGTITNLASTWTMPPYKLGAFPVNEIIS